MSNPIFYVYQYLTSEGNPYYIGKGSKDRINESHSPWVEIPEGSVPGRIICKNKGAK